MVECNSVMAIIFGSLLYTHTLSNLVLLSKSTTTQNINHAVNDEILYGVARFVSALLRGDETIKVWDIVEKENLNEHNKPELSPYLEVNDVIRVIDVDGEHARMPDTFDLYKVITLKLVVTQKACHTKNGLTNRWQLAV